MRSGSFYDVVSRVDCPISRAFLPKSGASDSSVSPVFFEERRSSSPAMQYAISSSESWCLRRLGADNDMRRNHDKYDHYKRGNRSLDGGAACGTLKMRNPICSSSRFARGGSYDFPSDRRTGRSNRDSCCNGPGGGRGYAKSMYGQNSRVGKCWATHVG